MHNSGGNGITAGVRKWWEDLGRKPISQDITWHARTEDMKQTRLTANVTSGKQEATRSLDAFYLDFALLCFRRLERDERQNHNQAASFSPGGGTENSLQRGVGVLSRALHSSRPPGVCSGEESLHLHERAAHLESRGVSLSFPFFGEETSLFKGDV